MVWFLGCAGQGQELDSVILMCPFQFNRFCDMCSDLSFPHQVSFATFCTVTVPEKEERLIIEG